MINVHLCNDEKFINYAIKRFEKEYPDQNKFLINKKLNSDLKSISQFDNVIKFDFYENDIILFIMDLKRKDENINLFIHYLNFPKSLVYSKLISQIQIKSYWIFYGGDLYNRLYKSGKFEMYDINLQNSNFLKKIKNALRILYVKVVQFKEEKLARKFIESVDFFCFWNYSDYLLLKENFNTRAKYKWFIYDAMYNFDTYYQGLKNDTKNVLINHSAAQSGNHLTILKKINIDKYKNKITKLIVPLNYGNEKNKIILNQYCEINFPENYFSMLNFLSEEEYFRTISDIDIAIFGNRRQQAGANIIYLLAMGTKVYLRESNTLFSYFKSQGITIFSFENDFDENSFLSPLPNEIQISNRNIIIELFSESSINNIYIDLI